MSTLRLSSLMKCKLKGHELHCSDVGSLAYVANELDQIQELLGHKVILVNADKRPLTDAMAEYVHWVIDEQARQEMFP